METFPQGRFDDLALLTRTAGNFWSEIFDGRELVADYLRGAAAQERQLEQAAQELYDSMGRRTCPVYHTDLWHLVELSEADGVANGSSREYPAEPALKQAYLATDAITNPSACLTGGVDFYLAPDRARLVLARDPFFDSRFSPFTGDDGVRRVRLYLFMARLDWRYVQKLYGSVLGLEGESSERYKDLVNAALDAVAGGTGSDHVAACVEAMTGVPRARGDETVEVVTSDAAGLLIVTDRNVYRFEPGATPLVSAGDQLGYGDPLVDAVRVYEPNRGEVPAPLSAMAVGRGLLMTPAGGELVFENRDLPLAVTTGVSGKTKVSFPLGGFQADADAFFAEMHARGVAAGKTLANYLDLRPQPQTTEPAALNLPASVNPLGLLFANLLRYSAYVVYVRVKDLGRDGAGLDKFDVLRRVTPPHAAVLLFLELPDLADDVNMSGSGSAAETGYSESYELFTV